MSGPGRGAAPAPSSLAGGEAEGESVALMRPFWVSWWGDPGTFELHRPWWVSGERDDGKQSICAAVLAQDEFTARLSVQWAHDDKDVVLEWRFVEEKPKGWSPFGDRFRQADWMRWPENAALSPEAPARIVGTIAHVSNGRSELAAQITAALTPRHEAPADPCASHRSMGFHIDPCCAHCEAPAEGAGEAMDAGFEAWLNERNLLPNGAWDWPSIVAMLNHHEDALRARSSAPEAREEALGNLLAVIHGDGGHRALEVGTKQAALEAEKIVARLLSSAPEAREPVAWAVKDYADGWIIYVFEKAAKASAEARNGALVRPLYASAAPSADKLRTAVEALEVTIFCPQCALPHVDEGEWATTRRHKTHQCQGCGHEWRPFPFATVGVTHPAAPSADKLREALTWALAEIQGDTQYENDGQREAALDQALAALKAGGAK